MTFLTALTIGMVMTVAVVLAREDAPAAPAGRWFARGLRIRVQR
jgi:hypothetical protein